MHFKLFHDKRAFILKKPNILVDFQGFCSVLFNVAYEKQHTV